jgi:hypothetical protein
VVVVVSVGGSVVVVSDGGASFELVEQFCSQKAEGTRQHDYSNFVGTRKTLKTSSLLYA